MGDSRWLANLLAVFLSVLGPWLCGEEGEEDQEESA